MYFPRTKESAQTNRGFIRGPLLANKAKDKGMVADLVKCLETGDLMGIKEIKESLFLVTSFETRQLLAQCIEAHDAYDTKLNDLKGVLIV